MFSLIMKTNQRMIHYVYMKVKSVKTICYVSLGFSAAYFALYLVVSRFKTNDKMPVSLPYVVVHIDLKGSPPDLDYLSSLLPLLRMNGANGLLIEYEDMFPYNGSLKNLSAENCYKKKQLRKFLTQAVNMGFEIIPLIQTFGHMEHSLKLSQFAHLRENQIYPDSICPSHPETMLFIKSILLQIITFHKAVAPLKYIHVGCDEVFFINKCSRCRARNLDTLDIFMQHVMDVTEIVQNLSPHTTVLIWDDMIRGVKSKMWVDFEHIDYLEVVCWDYKPQVTVSHSNLLYYHRQFNKLWISSSFKGADGDIATFPDLKKRYMNHYSWMNLIRGYKFGGEYNIYEFKGIILTGWSRYSHMDAACELLPVSIPSLILNLLLIQKSKMLVTHLENDPDVFYEKYLQAELTHNLQCETLVKLEYLDTTLCKFDGVKLYNVLAEIMKANQQLLTSFYNNKTGLSSLNYYLKLGSANVIRLTKKFHWCKRALRLLNRLENNLTNAMSPYYDKVFIKEYVNFKVYNSRNIIDGLFRDIKKLLDTNMWTRRSIINKYTTFLKGVD